MADVTRNVLNAVHAVNVVLEVLLTSEHFSAMLTTIILLALFGLLSTMCFDFVSLKKLENFSANVASVIIRILVHVDVNHQLLATHVLLRAEGTLEIRRLVVLARHVNFQIPEVLILDAVVLLLVANIARDFFVECNKLVIASLFTSHDVQLSAVQSLVLGQSPLQLEPPRTLRTGEREFLLHFCPVSTHVLLESDLLIGDFAANLTFVLLRIFMRFHVIYKAPRRETFAVTFGTL